MKTIRRQFGRVLSIYPNSKGFGFVVMEKGKRLIDWGAKRVHKPKNKKCLAKAGELMKVYQPDAVVLPDDGDQRTCRRIRTLIGRIASLARRKGIEVVSVTRRQFFKRFARQGATTKYAIAVLLTKRFPPIRSMLPKPRKAWQSEDYRMGMFGAMSLIAKATCQS